MEGNPNYKIILSEESLKKIISYKNDLISRSLEPGAHLKKAIAAPTGQSLEEMTHEQFIELLLSTKKPTIFAETEIRCDGSDWNRRELEVLGDINIAIPVEVYDNGVWSPSDKFFSKHTTPLAAELLFTPGALLARGNIRGKLVNGREVEGTSPDFEEVVLRNELDQNRYNKLVERRLSPLFQHANESAKKEGVKAIITLPGIGCGQFAGKFRGKMGKCLDEALKNMIEKNASNYSNISCVYYDPFEECTNRDEIINGVKYRVRPARFNPGKAQLCNPRDYEDSGDDFSKLKLFKIVAWDHVSFPGNDYFIGSRNTDDGVAAAATNSMSIITSVKGEYKDGYYLPPGNYKNWKNVVRVNNVKLCAKNNVKIVSTNSSFV